MQLTELVAVVLSVTLVLSVCSSSDGLPVPPSLDGTVFMRDGIAVFKEGMDKRGTAFGTFAPTLNNTGWDVLHIKAGYADQDTDRSLMFAAGYLEGRLTADRITMHFRNVYPVFFSADKGVVFEGKARKWFLENDKWVRQLTSKPGAEADPVLRHLSYIIAQMDGLYEGFVAGGGKADKFIIFMLNAVGDLIDLQHALNGPPDWEKMSDAEFKLQTRLNTHCSALVKVLPGYENLFMAHSSWFSYYATMRMYKTYNFNTRDKDTGAHRTSFSSYPGFLESLDDFYMLSSNLVMLQTTNNVFNTSLYKTVSTESVLAWQRVRVANMMARDVQQWAKILQRYNSGTYNNQYMIIDLNKVHVKERLEDWTLTVVEQIPTLVEHSDQTNVLRRGYWPSYNVPFHEQVYNMSGYPQTVAKRGVDYSYGLAPRAKIFRRDANKVNNMTDFKAIMRFNDYKTDPYSEKNPCDTICCRGDLGATPEYDGCYDSKVTDLQSALELKAWIINGPSVGHGQLPVFSWKTVNSTLPHQGLPASYNFDWVEVKPFN